MDSRDFTRNFINTLMAAGLPYIRFQELRHLIATLSFTQGMHPKIVQVRLGKFTIGITLDILSHAIPEMRNDLARMLDGQFYPFAVKRFLGNENTPTYRHPRCDSNAQPTDSKKLDKPFHMC